jgi:hypothetical protein
MGWIEQLLSRKRSSWSPLAITTRSCRPRASHAYWSFLGALHLLASMLQGSGVVIYPELFAPTIVTLAIYG